MALAGWSERREATGEDDTFDVRGWPVRTLVDDRHAATVHGILSDARGVPRYLDLRLDRLDGRVLLPIGQAQADRAHRVVWVPGFVASGFAPIPRYAGEPAAVDRADEAAIVAAYRVAYDGRPVAPRPYSGRLDRPTPDDRPDAGAQLAPLGMLDGWRIADGEPDPRGWTVAAADARPVGTIEELLVDTRALKVRYFVCDIDEAGLALNRRDRHILVPAGYAHLDASHRVVLVPDLRPADIGRLPLYDPDRLEREIEEDLLDQAGDPRETDPFYDRPRFDPRRFFRPAAE